MSGDVRAFYAALGIELPGSAQHEASVRCFADPAAHNREDRDASCSVNLEHGAWNCHSCEAHGGAYDAALARGHSPRSAIDLMVTHGLTERRLSAADGGQRSRTARSPARKAPQPRPRPALEASEDDVRRWQEALFSEGCRELREAATRDRLWSEPAMRELQLGHDGERITIPIRNGAGRLRGVVRYLPGAKPKMICVRGTRLGLIPHPAQDASGRILLVEGVPDMLAARSRGWPAIAVPGVQAWQLRWARLFEWRNVTIAMDCDKAGRAAARRIADDLQGICLHRIVDLVPERSDGFDLTDWLLEQRQRQATRRRTCTPSSSSRPTITR